MEGKLEEGDQVSSEVGRGGRGGGGGNERFGRAEPQDSRRWRRAGLTGELGVEDSEFWLVGGRCC